MQIYLHFCYNSDAGGHGRSRSVETIYEKFLRIAEMRDINIEGRREWRLPGLSYAAGVMLCGEIERESESEENTLLKYGIEGV